MDSFYKTILKLTEYFAIGLVALSAVVIVVQVFFRYVLNASIGWSDEVLGYLLVWMSFAGAILAMHDRSHIGIDILSNFFPQRWKWVVDLLVDLLLLVFLLVFTYFSTLLCVKLFDNYGISIKLRMSTIYSILPISGFLMIVVIIRHVSLIIHKLYDEKWKID